jgi:hypothetical protein
VLPLVSLHRGLGDSGYQVFQVESTLVESDEALSIHLLSNDGIIAQLAAMGIMRILLDTGAQISLMDESVGKWIVNKVRSTIRLRGAFGSNRSHGIDHGELPLFVLGTDNSQLCNNGSTLATDVRATRYTTFTPTVEGGSQWALRYPPRRLPLKPTPRCSACARKRHGSLVRQPFVMGALSDRPRWGGDIG